ncbi:MAG TPA: endonuclease/exonuclease/phosphatase family protein [Angustibacter sp.]|nr:endonuclease/exonuclease/phosphatase family protein [Angustibacter sp.]
MRVATFNLWSGRSLPPRDPGTALAAPAVDGDRLARSVAALVELGVDVLAVQEVDHHQERSGGVDQLAAVAEAFGASHHRFAPTLTGVPGPASGWQRLPHGHGHDGEPAYGVGLVSRLPVLAWRVRPLTGSRAVLPMLLPQVPGDASGAKPPRVMFVPDEPRAALAAVVQGAHGPVTVISTHLSFAPLAARRQLRSVTRWARSLPGPRVLAGDLNLPGPVPAWLTGWTSLGRAATYPAPAPRVQLDHLLTDAGPSSGVVQALSLEVSDHLALVGDVDA